MKNDVLASELFLEWYEGELETFILETVRPTYVSKPLGIIIIGHEDGTWMAHKDEFREMGRSPQLALDELSTTLCGVWYRLAKIAPAHWGD